MPAQKEVVPTISVVCFSLEGARYAVPFSDIVELLEVPTYTRLPRVQPWVRGVSNVRGKLLPLIDLAAFVGASLTTPPKQQRVLVMDTSGIFVGLLVDEVMGIRHFPVDAFIEATSVQKGLSSYVEGRYRDGERIWNVFRTERLIDDTRFLSVTA